MIFDKLLAITLLCASTSLLNVDIREPSRALDDPNFVIYNSTSMEMQAYSTSKDEEYRLEPHSKLELNYTVHLNDWKVIFTGDFDDWDDTLWYEPFDDQNAPKNPNWQYGAAGTCYFNIETQNSYTGFGVYTHEYYDFDVDYYLDPNKWGGVQRGIQDWTGTTPLTRTNESFRIYKDTGTYVNAKDLIAKRMITAEGNPNYATLVYATIGGQYVNIANNFGYDGNVMTIAPTPGNDGEVQPYLLYYNGYTNRMRIGYEKPKDAENYPETGYMPVDTPTYFSRQNIGYISYTEDGQTEGFDAVKTGFDLVALAFGAIAPLFGYMIFPGMTLGFLLLIPTLIALTFAIIRLIKKGG